jgi:hypothetical protein
MELYRLTNRHLTWRPYVMSHGKHHAAVEIITAIAVKLSNRLCARAC